jgi:CBS domain-containing protein
MRKEHKIRKKSLREITADDLMQPNPVTYHQNATAFEIATALVKAHAGAITIVNEERKPIGIVTEYDLLRAIQEGKDLKKALPTEMMTEPVIVSEKTPLTEVLDTLVTGHLIHLPVVDHEERLIGLIERHDVLAAFLRLKPQ